MCGKPSLAQRAQELDGGGKTGRAAWESGQQYKPAGDRPIPLEVLNCSSPKDLPNNPSNVTFENLRHITFENAYAYMIVADQDVASTVSQGWAEVKSRIDKATTKFRTELEAWEQCNDQGSDGWSGATHDAAIRNLKASYPTIDKISDGADTLHKLTGSFSNTISNTREAIVSNYTAYTKGMANPHNRDVIKYAFDRYAQSVMTTTYAPNIQHIASNQPDFPTATPDVGKPPASPPPQPVSPVPHPTSPGAPIGGGGGPSGGPPPDMTPKFGAPKPQTTPQGLPISQIPMDPSAATASPMSGMQGLSDLANPLQSLSSPLQSALGQAMNAAQRTGGPGALGGPKNLGKLPPEGALKGLKGGSGAGAGGAGLRGPGIGKPAGAPATAAGSAAGRTVAAGSRAGVSGSPGAGMGAPGAGAPAAGHHGAAAGGPHQPSKALRRKKNGEQIIGDAEAVVAVLGEPARPDAPKPPDPT